VTPAFPDDADEKGDGPPDWEAFEPVYVAHRKRLMSAAAQYLGSSDEADDVVQDVFIQAARNAHTLRDSDAVVAWLRRMVVNACIDRHGKRKKPSESDPAARCAASSYRQWPTWTSRW
jgi:RNA polymerase sigma factor (sigma-70 family)